MVLVANTTVSSSNYDFDLGGRWQIQPLADTISGSVAYGLATTSTGITTNILPETTTSIINGQQYIIKFTGSTNFTALGASSNAVGTVFTASSTTTFTGNVTGTVAPTSFDNVNYTTIDNNDYAFVDVYID